MSISDLNINASIRAFAYPSLEFKKTQINDLIRNRCGADTNYEVKVNDGIIVGYVPENNDFNSAWFCKIYEQ